ncbi:MAG: phosphocholine cytidylyltransferase family protein [Xanthomonadales bacterium]|jgi:choline kinase|nr:phosphocholine cytidylyltransferase family protein [Xanthomonadales bacterium]
MHAIILAAGRGSRLAEHNPQGLPKCLMEFGGRSLLARHLDLLYRFGVGTVDLVVGYEAGRIIDHVATLDSRPDVAYHFNPRFELGSVLSLWAAEETLLAGDEVLVMDADVLYHPEILRRLIDSPVENCFLLDRHFEPNDEAVKIALHDGRMVDFRKTLPQGLEYDNVGESVGFFKFGKKAAECINNECARFEVEGLADTPHEEAVRNALLSCPLAFGYEDVSGLPWIEIDFPEDVVKAVEQTLPAIHADHPGF